MSVATVRRITPERHRDDRGWLSEIYSEPRFAALGLDCRFVQDNHSFSSAAFTLRGLHFQTPPRQQNKLVRCIRGHIFDVVVDVRRGSPTYGQWTSTELSAANGHDLFVPAGFAHGFLTLEPECEVLYKCSDTYAPEHDGGIRWDSIGITWPIPAGQTPILSAKDRALTTISNFDSPFEYHGGPLTPLV
jgi:dTDP-4-dehydrorhamnose 3,5-epimerase